VCACQTEREKKRPMRERRLRPDLSGMRVREGRERNRMCVRELCECGCVCERESKKDLT
jgi:hypothetical protein